MDTSHFAKAGLLTGPRNHRAVRHSSLSALVFSS